MAELLGGHCPPDLLVSPTHRGQPPQNPTQVGLSAQTPRMTPATFGMTPTTFGPLKFSYTSPPQFPCSDLCFGSFLGSPRYPKLLLGRLPQASKTWACPPSRPKTEPTASDRDTSMTSLGETYVSQARSWSHTPPCGEDGRRTWQRQPPLQGAEARLPITGGTDLRWAP